MKKRFKKNALTESGKEKLKSAFDKLKKSVNVEEIIKKSSQLVEQISDQIAEKVPQKIQDNFSLIGFSSKIDGIDSKLSVYRAVEINSDSTAEDNQVIGSQWFGVKLINKSEVKSNKFTAMQLTEFSLARSDLRGCQISLSRLSHLTFQEACFVKNKFSLCTWSDVSITESDFTENNLNRCDFSGTVINSSRLSKLSLNQTVFKDCEFDSCDIQGLEFENCEFNDCSFQKIEAVSAIPLKISGGRFVGKQFSHCTTAEEFISLLK
jgi:uncharacterized protein YjbI with pentapeptide repeats